MEPNLNDNQRIKYDLVLPSSDTRLKSLSQRDLMPGKRLEINGFPYITAGVRFNKTSGMHELLLIASNEALRVPAHHFSIQKRPAVELMRDRLVSFGGILYRSLGALRDVRNKEYTEVWFVRA